MMEYPLIYEYELTTRRPIGGKVEAAELIQREDGKWQIHVRVSWKPATFYSVTKFSILEIKLYSLATTALRHIVEKYKFYGPIIVQAKEGKLARNLI
jgi:uncharacterized Fe-S cluster-containing radical SAM superfamily protein